MNRKAIVLPLAFAAACLSVPFWSTLTQDSSAWHAIAVPGPWDENPQLAKHEGFVWFRCWVKAPAEWKGSDLAFAIEQVRNAHEVYWDGIRIGGAGDFPPRSEERRVGKEW